MQLGGAAPKEHIVDAGQYKLHWEVSDSQVSPSCVVTSASTHDSPVAIPLAAMTAQRVTARYEPMDAGYHSERIQAYCESLGHVAPIPDVERQNKPAVPMAPLRPHRFRRRRFLQEARVYCHGFSG